ncbi:MAG: SRPBCC domain-containing protein [Patescibacteria group bacterium]|nr:SRPBCC domain-containing protein [Patescibacteria group bacterium]MDE1945969.1 SRPBCC domain-containing protein [Patescibacteria group bacterium]
MNKQRELTLSRLLDAPIEKVWRAWTDPKSVAVWWGPQGVTNPVCEWNAKAGGIIHIVMLAGKELGPLAGQRWPMRGIFKEVVPNTRLVFTNKAVDEKDETLIDGSTTVTFKSVGAKMEMTVHIIAAGKAPVAEQMLAGMETGWNQQLDKLAAFVK